MISLKTLALVFPVLLAGSAQDPQDPIIATFSIVAFDPETKELGVAVASRALAVGSIAPFAKAGIGAISTQAAANVTYGPKGLDMLAEGMSPDQVLEKLLGEDEGRARRQVGIIDAEGNARTYTGDGCSDWAGGIAGKNFAVQGNILTGEAVVKAMAETFEKAEGDLGTRMLAAMEAGQAAGGDSRGRQSASILIVLEGRGYGGLNDRYRDYRVDDHTTPIQELKRIYDIGNRRRGRRRR